MEKTRESKEITRTIRVEFKPTDRNTKGWTFFIENYNFDEYSEVKLYIEISKSSLKFEIVDDYIDMIFENKDGVMYRREKICHCSINQTIDRMLYYYNVQLLGDRYNTSYRQGLANINDSKYGHLIKNEPSKKSFLKSIFNFIGF